MAGDLQVPTEGSPRSTEEPKIATAVSTLNSLLTGDNELDGSQIADATVPNAALAGSISAGNLAGSIPDSKLASPNNSVYRTLMRAKGFLANDAAAATYPLGAHNYATGGATAGLRSGSIFVSTTDLVVPPDLIYFDDADYAVAGLTQKLRLRAVVSANATAPAITFTFGLYPVTVAGTTDAVTFTLGTVVASSTVAIASPSASTVTSGVNSDFTIPADGAYVLGVVTSGTLTNNAAVVLNAQLQTRNV